MADAKTTALTETTTPVLTDIIMIVVDPSGTPVSKKVSLTNLKSLIVNDSWLKNQVFS